MVVPYPAENLFGCGMQVDHLATLVQLVPIGLPQNSTAASGQNTAVISRQLVDYFLLKIAESLLTLALKKIANRAPCAPFYDEV